MNNVDKDSAAYKFSYRLGQVVGAALVLADVVGAVYVAHLLVLLLIHAAGVTR